MKGKTHISEMAERSKALTMLSKLHDSMGHLTEIYYIARCLQLLIEIRVTQKKK